MILHTIAFVLGTILDLIIGDPYQLPHPIRLIGSWIGCLDRFFLGEKGKEQSGDTHMPQKRRVQGALLCLLVCGATILVTALALAGAYLLHPLAGFILESILTCYILAAKSLYTESMKVYNALQSEGIEAARRAVAMIVGRDTQQLDRIGVTRAAVETVAENTSDGVIAPMLYTALGGPVLGFFYKAVNTMDSMVGYHNDRYEDFGFVPAKLDDCLNYLPSRLSALFLLAGAWILGMRNGFARYNPKEGLRIWRRDRRKHKSPNSAQTESACAGILGIELAGDASYFGKIVKKPTIGDPLRPVEEADIRWTNHLMFAAEAVTFLVCMGFLCIACLMQ